MFLDGSTLPVVSAKTGVPLSTLRGWSREDQWSVARRELKLELQESSEAQLSKLQADKVVKVVTDQLDLLDELHQKVRDTFKKYSDKGWNFSPDALKALTGCLKSANDVAARLLHLDDPSRPVDKQVNVSGSALIQFGASAAPLGLAPSPKPDEPKTIDVEEIKTGQASGPLVASVADAGDPF